MLDVKGDSDSAGMYAWVFGALMPEPPGAGGADPRWRLAFSRLAGRVRQLSSGRTQDLTIRNVPTLCYLESPYLTGSYGLLV